MFLHSEGDLQATQSPVEPDSNRPHNRVLVLSVFPFRFQNVFHDRCGRLELEHL